MIPSVKQHALAFPTGRDPRRAHSERDLDSLIRVAIPALTTCSEIPARVTIPPRVRQGLSRLRDCR